MITEKKIFDCDVKEKNLGSTLWIKKRIANLYLESSVHFWIRYFTDMYILSFNIDILTYKT